MSVLALEKGQLIFSAVKVLKGVADAVVDIAFEVVGKESESHDQGHDFST